jgi:hypothetical protein
MATKNQTPSTKINKVQVPLRFNVPDNMPSVYATNLLVQATEQEVVISFFEAQPPLLMTDDVEENLEILKKVGIKADCVARVTISPARFEGFVQVLADFISGVKARNKK